VIAFDKVLEACVARMGDQSPQNDTALAGIQSYYDQTWLDYRALWLNPANRAIHFGYWDSTTRSHAESLLNMNRALAARLDLRPGHRVLDAGCGVGGSAMWLAETYQVHVIGITPVESQVARARRYARERGLDHVVAFEVQDYLSPQFPDAYFDAIWAQESVCHTAEKSRFVAMAYRLLKPGGQLVVAEYLRTTRPHTDSQERLLHSWLDGWAIPDLATEEEFGSWCRQVGFRNVDVTNITPNVRPSLRRLYLLVRFLSPVHMALRALRLRSEVQAGNFRGARDQWRALQQNLWFYGVLSATKPSI